MSRLFDDYKTFILVHYTTSRTDTEFWRNANLLARNHEPVKDILDICKDRLLNESDLDPYYGYVQAELYNYILCGLGHYTKETATLESRLMYRNEEAKKEEARITEFLSKHNWLTNKEILEYIRR